ncbi:hypothetical protein [Geminicoccus flavidas]|uniref:hypothetical protein n=1 Tax=Geminicoccus flavidas TaxID=2506407 RepID=UPI001356C665|nr:hypothetical protein [Geminicoccus flavidas]
MAMTKKYDLAVKTGTYQKDGETKNRYENIGAVFQGDDGPFIVMKRSFNPAGVPFKEGSDSIMVSCFAPKDSNGGNGGGQRQAAPAQRQAPAQRSDMDDDIPF